MRQRMMILGLLLEGDDLLVVTEQGIRDSVRQVMIPLWNSWYFFQLYAKGDYDPAVMTDGNRVSAPIRFATSSGAPASAAPERLQPDQSTSGAGLGVTTPPGPTVRQTEAYAGAAVVTPRATSAAARMAALARRRRPDRRSEHLAPPRRGRAARLDVVEIGRAHV